MPGKICHISDRSIPKSGDVQDLEAAVQNYQTAVELTPGGHSERPWYLYSIAVGLGEWYHRLGHLHQEAVDLTPEGHHNRTRYLHNLAVSFGDRYRRLRDLKDLEAELNSYQAAAELKYRIIKSLVWLLVPNIKGSDT